MIGEGGKEKKKRKKIEGQHGKSWSCSKGTKRERKRMQAIFITHYVKSRKSYPLVAQLIVQVCFIMSSPT